MAPGSKRMRRPRTSACIGTTTSSMRCPRGWGGNRSGASRRSRRCTRSRSRASIPRGGSISRGANRNRSRPRGRLGGFDLEAPADRRGGWSAAQPIDEGGDRSGIENAAAHRRTRGFPPGFGNGEVEGGALPLRTGCSRTRRGNPGSMARAVAAVSSLHPSQTRRISRSPP